MGMSLFANKKMGFLDIVRCAALKAKKEKELAA